MSIRPLYTRYYAVRQRVARSSKVPIILRSPPSVGAIYLGLGTLAMPGNGRPRPTAMGRGSGVRPVWGGIVRRANSAAPPPGDLDRCKASKFMHISSYA